MLVWIGDTGETPKVSSPPSHTTTVCHRPDLLHPSPARARPKPNDVNSPSCSATWSDSTTLSSQLDPEEYREVVRAYQRVCSEVITRFAGHIAQLLGDGLLVYFGYPQAHEDDAHRAVRTGLGILEAMGDLNAQSATSQGIPLAIRMGIHTGLVVIGDMGGQGVRNVGARRSAKHRCSHPGRAEPNTIAIVKHLRVSPRLFRVSGLGSPDPPRCGGALHVYRVSRRVVP